MDLPGEKPGKSANKALTSGPLGDIMALAMWCSAPVIAGPLAQLVRAGGS